MTATNRFAALLQRAAGERWCTDPRCATCGASGFREGLRQLGPGLADDLAGADLDRLQHFADWSGALRLALDELGDADSMDRVLTAWLPQLERQIRAADLVLFYYVRRGAVFAPMSVDVLERWVDKCVEVAIRSRDESLVESLVYTLGARRVEYPTFDALARDLARSSAPIARALGRN